MTSRLDLYTIDHLPFLLIRYPKNAEIAMTNDSNDISKNSWTKK